MSDPEQRDLQALQQTIAFGMDVKAFMGTTMGKYLTNRANAQIVQAQVALGSVDAEDPKAIRTLQNQIAAASFFLQWMGEAVTEGEQAESTYIDADAQQG